MSNDRTGTDIDRTDEISSNQGLFPIVPEKDLKTAAMQTTTKIRKENGWTAVFLGWIAGSIVLVSHLAIGASPESSYIEWSAFIFGITVSLVVIRFYFGQLSGFLVLLPLLLWNLFWTLVHASMGNLCASCLLVISGSLLLIAVVHFSFKLFGLRSER